MEFMIYFTSDTHYFHKNVIEFCNRPFKDLDEMHEQLINRYNSKVKDGDTCIFVGDFSFGGAIQTKSILEQLNGIKILVRGNHDKASAVNKFDVCIYETSMRIVGKRITLSHYPFLPGFGELNIKWWQRMLVNIEDRVRFVDRRPKDSGQFLIHGHTHSTNKFKGRQIHVGVDAWDYYPVSMKQLSKYIEAYRGD